MTRTGSTRQRQGARERLPRRQQDPPARLLTRFPPAQALNFDKVEKRVNTVAGGSTGSVRNLRIREDTAKYLLNLDLDSAYYDPKSRSMREDPNPDKPAQDKYYFGDNFIRSNGQEFQEFMELQMHSMEAYDKGFDSHAHAAPSQAEALFKEFKARKDKLVNAKKENVLDRYGSAAEPMPEDVAALGATEAYVEYDRAGRLIKGQERRKARSRYPEDQLINNHTSIFGSFWKEGQWGYACCHSFVKNSFCTGAKGQLAEQEAQQALVSRTQAAEERRAAGQDASSSKPRGSGAAAWGTDIPEGTGPLDSAKVKEAMQRLEEQERGAEADDRKRGYHSFKALDSEVSAEEMEAYRLKRGRTDDPAAAFLKEGGSGAEGGSGYGFV